MDVNPLVVKKIQMLINAQILMNSIEDLKNTNAYNHRVKTTGNQFLIALDQELQKEIKKIWFNDDMLSVNLMQSYQEVARQISECDNPALIIKFGQLFRNGLDLNKVKIIEMKRKIYKTRQK